MEGREKKARLNSLSELRRLRNEGGNRLDNALKKDEKDDSIGHEYYIEDDDDDGFVEHDDHGAEGRSSKRSSIFLFKPKTGLAVERKVDVKVLEKDEFLKSLLSKVDEEAELDKSDSEGHSKTEIGIDRIPPSNALKTKHSISNSNLADTEGPKDDTCCFQKASQMQSEAVLSSEYAPIESNCFEIDENIFHNTEWLDDEIIEFDAGIRMAEEKVIKDEIGVKESYLTDIDRVEPAPLSTSLCDSKDELVNFYWIDAYEKHDGVLYIFGKTFQNGSLASCCVIINNMLRSLFFLPRETIVDSEQEVTLGDVHQEITQLAAIHRIGKFGCKKVSRKYAFEIPDMPIEADYIKMVYPYSAPQLPRDLGGRSFSRIFGVATSALELFLIKRRIMGPCWLQFKPSRTGSRNVSWCKIEMEVDEPKEIKPLLNGPPPPPLSVLSLVIRTIVEPTSKTHEIVAASGLVFNSMPIESSSSNAAPKCSAVFSVAREAENVGFTDKFIHDTASLYRQEGGGKIELVKNERGLLGFLISMIYRTDPDVIVGHDILGFDLGVLLHRMRACKVDYWSRIGRLNWSQ